MFELFECSHPPTCMPWLCVMGMGLAVPIMVWFLAQKTQTLLLPMVGLCGCREEQESKALCPAGCHWGLANPSGVSWGCPGWWGRAASASVSMLSYWPCQRGWLTPEKLLFLGSVLASRANLSCAAPTWPLGSCGEPPHSTLGVSFSALSALCFQPVHASSQHPDLEDC